MCARRLRTPGYRVAKVTPLIHKRSTTRRLGTDLDAVAALSRNELLGVAIARGCHHYAPFVAPEFVADQPALSHELLGCALLRGPADLDTFQGEQIGVRLLIFQSGIGSKQWQPDPSPIRLLPGPNDPKNNSLLFS